MDESAPGFSPTYILPQRRGYKHTLQRDNTVNSKQYFLKVIVSDLYIPMIGLPILLQENMWSDPGNIQNCSQTHEYGNRD
jgi:hypothetical protein